ncbi:MAG: ribosomal protein S18-alanine N-acetyltransferase [Terracidiphilus sp.]|nr:ribosomal protein S18-alanine N-acetyltransferase [Terracidiphilus sp.]
MTSSAGAASIRSMCADDLDRVLEIADNLSEAPHWNRAAYLVALDTLAQPRRFAFVAERAGCVAGFAVASCVGDEAELESIGVDLSGQRLGFGRKLMEALTEALRAEEARRMLLEVRASNLCAIAFYSALGWAECGRRRRYYSDPEEDALLLSLQLQ